MLLCIEYGILFVDTVDTKIKARNALVEYVLVFSDYQIPWIHWIPVAFRENSITVNDFEGFRSPAGFVYNFVCCISLNIGNNIINLMSTL